MQIGSVLCPVMKNNFICLFINKVLGNITRSSFLFGPILTGDFALQGADRLLRLGGGGGWWGVQFSKRLDFGGSIILKMHKM